jgi:hypothetical protein
MAMSIPTAGQSKLRGIARSHPLGMINFRRIYMLIADFTTSARNGPGQMKVYIFGKRYLPTLQV